MKKNLVVITGASKGLGFCIAENLLDQRSLVGEENIVINISRSDSPTVNKNLVNINADLTGIENLEQFLSTHLDSYRDKTWVNIILINNAATINPISEITRITTEDLAKATNINFLTPFILTKYFVNNFTNCQSLKIVNISSGAASSNIDGWSVYCSTKAALNRFTENMDSEYSENKKVSFVIFNPGIMDTAMQQGIRNSEFKDKEKFIEFKNSGQLRSPEVVSKHLINLISKEITNLYESI